MNTLRKEELTIAIDFDGTIVEDNFPAIGTIKEETVEFMEKLKKQGHTIIVWTCREGEELEKAKEFLKKEQIPFDYLNENDQKLINKYDNDCRKVGADFYIDDKAVNVSKLFVLESKLEEAGLINF